MCDLIKDAGDEIDGVLLLIDEADKPPQSAHLGELCKLLTERLAHRNCERVSIGLAGLPGLIGKLRASHESSPRVFDVLTLEPLTDGERKTVIQRGLAEAQKINNIITAITDDGANVIANLSDGYPHFIQQFSYCAFDTDTDNNIDVTDVYVGAFDEACGAFHRAWPVPRLSRSCSLPRSE
jgi:type II secretory pathway predicted ATPase ExeA